MTKHDIDTQCCPKFDPEPWHDKEIIWKDKLFVKDTMPQFMHMPHLTHLVSSIVGNHSTFSLG